MKQSKIILSAFIILLLIALPCIPAAAELPTIEITAENALVIDLDTDFVAYSKNPDEKVHPAGAVKIMTAILAFEKTKDLTEKITADEKAYAGITSLSGAKIQKGEVVMLGDLLHALFLSSSNEAANVLAYYVSQDIDEFVKLMNEKAAELGCVNTKFTNPTGVYDPEAFSTANDIALISRCMVQIKELYVISGTYTYYIEPTNLNDKRRLLINGNQTDVQTSAYYLRDIHGLKTSGVTVGGYSLISMGERKINRKPTKVLFILLGCPKGNTAAMANVYTDMKTLTSWFYENFTLASLLSLNQPITEITVKLAQKKDSVVLSTAKSLDVLVPSGFDEKNLVNTLDLPDYILAPVEKGQVVGTISVKYDNFEYGSVELVAASSLTRDELLWYSYQINNFFSNIWVKLISGLFAASFIMYVSFSIYYNKQKKKRKSVKRRIKL